MTRWLNVMRATRTALIALEHWGDTLAGACGLGAAILTKTIPSAQFQIGHFETTLNDRPFFVMHAWAETPEYVLDVTATQFSEFFEDELVIMPRQTARAWYSPSFARGAKARQVCAYEEYYGIDIDALARRVMTDASRRRLRQYRNRRARF